jgi:ABC-type uncharacterized transport system substrate-binding protein
VAATVVTFLKRRPQATDKIPIIMTVGADRIGSGGIIASLARPGGDVTGISALASSG